MNSGLSLYMGRAEFSHVPIHGQDQITQVNISHSKLNNVLVIYSLCFRRLTGMNSSLSMFRDRTEYVQDRVLII
jgi:hypothetical protein